MSKKSKNKNLFFKTLFNLRAWWVLASQLLIFVSVIAVFWASRTTIKNAQYRTDIDSLQNEIVKKDKQLAIKQDSIAYLADQFRVIKIQLSDMQLKYNGLEKEYQKVKKDYNVLGDDLITKLNGMKSNLYAMSNQIAEIEKKIRGKQGKTR